MIFGSNGVNCEVFNAIFFNVLFKKFLVVFAVIIMFIFLFKKLYNEFVVINFLVIFFFFFEILFGNVSF